jgi:hypothetical protein
MSESQEPQAESQMPAQVAVPEEIIIDGDRTLSDSHPNIIFYLLRRYAVHLFLFTSGTVVIITEIDVLLLGLTGGHGTFPGSLVWMLPALPYVLLLPPALYSTIVLHELGHLLVIWLVGFRCQGGNLGPFVITRSHQGMRFKLMKLDRTQARGEVIFLCRGIRLLRLRRFVVTLAGPLSNLIFCMLAALIAVPLMQDAIVKRSTNLLGLGIIIIWFALINLAIGVGSLIPFRRKNKQNASDGAKLLDYLCRGSKVDFESVVMSMRSHVSINHNLSSCPVELVQRVQTLLPQQPFDPKSPYQFLASFYLYYYARYADNISQALIYTKILEQVDHDILAKLPSLRLDRGYFAARYLIDQAKAQEQLVKLGDSAKPHLDLLRIRAALELRAGNYQQAIERAQEGLALMEEKHLDMTDLKATDLRGIVAEAQEALSRSHA